MPAYIDLHSHILPGLDEGAKSVEDALAMAKALFSAGYSHVVGTPHVLTGLYTNTPHGIQGKSDEVGRALQEAGIPLTVLPGAEYYWDFEFYTLMEKGHIQTINGTGQYVLVEFPAVGIPRGVEEVAFKMGIKGIKPLLAHPERNSEIISDFHKAVLMEKWGFLLVVDLLSLIGAHGPEVKKTAERLLKSDALYSVASDAHTVKNIQDGITLGFPLIKKIIGNDGLERILHTNPLVIIEGRTPSPKQQGDA